MIGTEVVVYSITIVISGSFLMGFNLPVGTLSGAVTIPRPEAEAREGA